MSDSDLPVSRERLADLMLIRLLAANKNFGPSDLYKAVEKYLTSGEFASSEKTRSLTMALLEQLREAGLVEKKGAHLTEAGREKALSKIACKKIPPGRPFQYIENRYLTALALGISPKSDAEWKDLAAAEGLRGAIIAKFFNLPLGPVPKPGNAVNFLAWQQFGKPLRQSVDMTRPVTSTNVLRVSIVKNQKAKPKDAIPGELLKTANNTAAAVRRALISRWLCNGGTAAIPFDDSRFAESVSSIARSSKTGVLGDQVFISHVWRQFQNEASEFRGMTRQDFDKRLLEAHRASRLSLGRADLVDRMDPNDVRDSEMTTPAGLFHFVNVRR